MNKKKNIQKSIIIIFILTSSALNAQDSITTFGNPLPGELQVSGTYGEIRDNHFHTGIDLKTSSKEGMTVLAATDGYVSRIKVSESGFGKVIYLTHKDNYVTVYAHLHKFCEKIDTVVYNEQMNKKAFEIELFPDKNKYYFHKGDTIALSGNSGGSQAPHLHFEIREEKSEHPLNPTPQFIHVTDTMLPIVSRIYIYKVSDDFSQIDSLTSFEPYSFDNIHYFSKGPIKASGRIAIGFSAYDKATNDSSILGLAESVLLLNNDPIFLCRLNNFSFDEKRYALAHIDYAAKINSDIIVERCFILPEDYFSQYGKRNENAVFNIDFIKEANMLLYLRDASGKLISVRFQLVGESAPTLSATGTVMHEDIIMDDAAPPRDFKKPVNYKTENSSVDISPATFYRNVNFWMSENESDKKYYSSIISVYKETEPLQRAITLNIKPKNLPASLQSKALIVKIKNNIEIPISSYYAKDMVSARILSLGNYAIVVDDVNPVIGNIKLSYDSLSNCRTIEIDATDNLSGITKHECFINDEWALSEYISKENKIVCYIKNKAVQKFTFKMRVEDAKGNATESNTKLQVENKSGN